MAITFFDLPPEVRNIIYELLKDTSEHCTDVYIHEWKLRADFPYAITRTSKQIREESSAMFYKGVSIHLDMPDDQGYTNCKEWLEIIHDSAIPAAASFEITAVNGKCKCETACLVQVLIRVEGGMDSEDDSSGDEETENRRKVIVEVEGLGQKKACWTKSKLKVLKTACERKVKELQPVDGMMRMPKAALEEIVDRAAGKYGRKAGGRL